MFSQAWIVFIHAVNVNNGNAS